MDRSRVHGIVEDASLARKHLVATSTRSPATGGIRRRNLLGIDQQITSALAAEPGDAMGRHLSGVREIFGGDVIA